MYSELILVEFPWGRDKDPRVPLGHASILATLKFNSGLKCHSIVRPINDEKFNPKSVESELMKIVSSTENEIDIAFGVYVWCEDVVQSICISLRENGFTGRIILGGPQISYSGEGLENHYPEADVFVRGYGEFALTELMSSTSKIEMSGVHYAGDEDLQQQTIVNLDLCPSPWLEGIINLENQKFVRWETQRGCQFSCGFCQHKEAGARLKKHTFLMNRIQNEIDLFCRSKVQDIAVLDPIFNSGRQAVAILNRFIENEYSGRISLQCRIEMITDEFIQAASQLNARLEFGLQTIHLAEGNAVNRKNNMRKVESNLEKIKLAGIDYEISLIYGLPNQTLVSFKETLEWCLSRKVPVIKAFPLMLLRGTDTEKRKDIWGLVESDDTMPVVIQSNTFSFNEWNEMGQLSQALKNSEGNHPESVESLIRQSQYCKLDISRFIPKLSDVKTGQDAEIETSAF